MTVDEILSQHIRNILTPYYDEKRAFVGNEKTKKRLCDALMTKLCTDVPIGELKSSISNTVKAFFGQGESDD